LNYLKSALPSPMEKNLCQFEKQDGPRTATSPRLAPLNGQGWTGVKEKEFKNRFDVYDGAPCQWSKDREATHTLWLGDHFAKGPRPAKLLKTVMYVGVDEVDGKLIWEKWQIKTEFRKDV